MIVSRLAIVTEDLMIRCHQVTKNFCTRYDFTSTSSARARGPCNFSLVVDLAISVFRDMNINTVFTRCHFSAALKMVHGKNSRASLFVQELFHPQDSVWILAATRYVGMQTVIRSSSTCFGEFSDFALHRQHSLCPFLNGTGCVHSHVDQQKRFLIFCVDSKCLVAGFDGGSAFLQFSTRAWE